MRRLRQQVQCLGGALLEQQHARFNTAIACHRLAQTLDARRQIGTPRHHLHNAEALFTLAHQMMPTLTRGDMAHHTGQRSDGMQIIGPRFIACRIALHHQSDEAFTAHRLLRGGDRGGTAHAKRQNHPREQHTATHRDDGHYVGWQTVNRLALVTTRRNAMRRCGLVVSV